MKFKMFAAAIFYVASPMMLGAQTAPVKVLVSNGMKAVVERLRTRLEGELGRPLAIQYGTSAAVRQRVEAGEAFDALILTTEVVGELAKTGKVTASSVVDLGRSGIGFGIGAGARKPDISTPDAVKQTLLNAKSLTWVSVGASRVHIDRMLESLGIAKQVESKVRLTQGVDDSVQSVADGKTEMIITLTSEILPVKTVQYVGPLPAKFQNYVRFSGAVGPKSAAPAASALLLKQLSSPSVARMYEAVGMELPTVTDTRPRAPVK